MSVQSFVTDVIYTSAGDLIITFLGHGSLIFNWNGMTIHVDPYSKVADYSQLPKADLIVITHEHRDHLDLTALASILTGETQVVMTPACKKQLSETSGGNHYVLKNGDEQTLKDLHIEAVPAYNIVHLRPDGQPFHPKGMGNGYIFTFGDVRVYVAGDTEDIPEMEMVGKVDIAFLPMNLPYTMTPEMTANAARMIKPRILYPYHFGSTDLNSLVNLLKNEPEIEVRLRELA